MAKQQAPIAFVVEQAELAPHFVVLTPDKAPETTIRAFLLELLAADKSLATIKTYAFSLVGWLRFLHDRQKTWDEADSLDVRDYVLFLRQAANPYRVRRHPVSAVNAKTGKANLTSGYRASTINHRLSVLKAFYTFAERQGELGSNPLADGIRRHAHHNPLAPWRPVKRGLYRQRQPKQLPRALSDDLYNEVFQCLQSERDRAIFSLLVSSGCRAQELLGMTCSDVDWGGQHVRLTTKGSRDEAAIAASPEFFRWVALYLAQRPNWSGTDPLWITTRGKTRPLNYQALRGILNRINVRLNTNLSLHDFRHTCAMRLARDPNLSLVTIQAHLRHKHLTTTQQYLIARPDDVIQAIHNHERRPPPPSVTSTWTYDNADLNILFGQENG